MRKFVGLMVATAFSVSAGVANAQVEQTQPTEVPPQQMVAQPMAQPVPPPPPVAPPPVARSTENPPTDHAQVVHRIGLHYFGAPAVGTLTATGTASTDGSPVPTVGMRYWFTDHIALEAGVGIGLSTGTASMSSGGTTTGTAVPGATLLGVQAGLPIMLADFQHVTFFIDPFVAFYYGNGAMDVNNGGAITSYRLNTILFRVGAAVAAEVHLGFMHLPQVSVEASFGIQLNVQNQSLDVFDNGNQTNTSGTQVGFGTTLGDFAFQNLFLSSIAATYHF